MVITTEIFISLQSGRFEGGPAGSATDANKLLGATANIRVSPAIPLKGRDKVPANGYPRDQVSPQPQIRLTLCAGEPPLVVMRWHASAAAC